MDTKDKQEEILLKLYKNKKVNSFINVLELCYDVDYKTFRKTIIYDVIKDFLNYCRTSYQGFDLDENLIRERQSLNFGMTSLVVIRVSGDWLKSEVQDKDLISSILKLAIPFFSNVDQKELHLSVQFEDVYKSDAIVLVFHSDLYQILKLLHNKREKFIRKLPIQKVNVDVSDFQYNYPISINDDADSILNSSKNFQLTNALLKQAFDWYILDINECEKELYTIKKEKESESSNNIFLEGL